MVNSNKVLTVSYGTFSCTLEGFDDSFETMKAIAEYFRDLASDDRYFGAEPPQPDADMLARIAQRDVTRRVEARHEGSGIVLRASEGATTAPATSQVVDAPIVEDVVDAVTTEDETDPVAADIVLDAETVPVSDDDGTDQVDTAASIDMDNDPVIDTAVVEAAIVEAAEDIEDAVDDKITETVAITKDTIEDATSVPETPEETAADEPVDDDEATSQPDVAEDIVAPADQPPADSIAAKLQRIRAVVARNEALGDDDEFTEDLQADSFVAAAASEISDTLAGEDESNDDDDGQAISAILGQLDDKPVTSDESETVDPAKNTSLFEDLESPAEVEKTVEDDSTASAPVATPEPETAAQITENVAATVPTPETSEVSDSETVSKASRKIRRVRVKKVKRSDLEQAIASGAIEAVEDPEPTLPPAKRPRRKSSLTAEDEADLMRELAEVEAEFKAPVENEAVDLTAEMAVKNDTQDSVDQEASAEDDSGTDLDVAPLVKADVAVADRGAQALADADQDEDVSRLMATAKEKLDDPETTSKAEAYQNLRAAVAATQADRDAGGDLGTETKDDAYRADLAKVVQPRRPAAIGNTASPRPRMVAKSAPLKLVAEQRINDADDVQSATPVRPRRVATAQDVSESAENTDEFSAFIEEMDVHSLVELLEATASYMSFAEDREQFSRPQLMNKVRQVHSDDFNREDGLRAFGQLLREGKIEKAGGGRFAASGDIGFQPQARAVG